MIISIKSVLCFYWIFPWPLTWYLSWIEFLKFSKALQKFPGLFSVYGNISSPFLAILWQLSCVDFPWSSIPMHSHCHWQRYYHAPTFQQHCCHPLKRALLNLKERYITLTLSKYFTSEHSSFIYHYYHSCLFTGE